MHTHLQPHHDPQRIDASDAQARTGEACGRVGGVAEKRSVMIQSLQRLAAVLALLLSLLAPAHASAMLDPGLGRFNQRDPHPDTYPDGMNAYAGYHVIWGGVDPWGLQSTSGGYEETTDHSEKVEVADEVKCSEANEWTMNSVFLAKSIISAEETKNEREVIRGIKYVLSGVSMDVKCRKDENGNITGTATPDQERERTYNDGSVRSAIKDEVYNIGQPKQFIEKYVIPSLPMWIYSTADDSDSAKCLKSAVAAPLGPLNYESHDNE